MRYLRPVRTIAGYSVLFVVKMKKDDRLPAHMTMSCMQVRSGRQATHWGSIIQL